ncbi:hypothetical protein ACFVH9_18400 [Streptomyces hirsutus]|uniref:hypothetical protein n=1 Tax=Streptomyces hirsutus TaxID=35620 RepID=UPI0036388C08
MGQVVAVTIGLSVLLHGMSAPFFADLYGNWYDAAKAVALDLREAQGIPEDIGTPHGGSRRLRRAGRAEGAASARPAGQRPLRCAHSPHDTANRGHRCACGCPRTRLLLLTRPVES